MFDIDDIMYNLILENENEFQYKKVVRSKYCGDYDIKIDFEEDGPNDIQKKAYEYFIKNMDTIFRNGYAILKRYLATLDLSPSDLKYAGLASTSPGDLRRIKYPVHPIRVDFFETGRFAIVMSVPWDDEHGAYILCGYPSTKLMIASDYNSVLSFCVYKREKNEYIFENFMDYLVEDGLDELILNEVYAIGNYHHNGKSVRLKLAYRKTNIRIIDSLGQVSPWAIAVKGLNKLQTSMKSGYIQDGLDEIPSNCTPKYLLVNIDSYGGISALHILYMEPSTTKNWVVNSYLLCRSIQPLANLVKQ